MCAMTLAAAIRSIRYCSRLYDAYPHQEGFHETHIGKALKKRRVFLQLFHGDKTLATPELRYSLAIDDELPLAHVELAISLQAGGKADQALYVLEQAAARFPTSVELRCFHAEMVGAAGDLVR